MNILLIEKKALVILSLLHIFVIAASNYLVQFPFTVNLGFTSVDTTPGSFTFPLIFLATDLTVRIFGSSLARTIIFVVMIPALIVSYVISILFINAEFAGFSGFREFNIDIFRIALASFCAYTSGQLTDVLVFNRLRRNRRWWLAPGSATVIGSAVDTLIFFFVAFYKASDEYMAANWFNLGFVDYLTKLAVSLVFFLPVYGIFLKFLLKYIKNTSK